MGSRIGFVYLNGRTKTIVVLARNIFQWQVDETEIAAHLFNQKTKQNLKINNMMVKSETVCLVVLMSITLSSCLPLNLGFGGFFTNLASIQKNINSQAKLNKARLGTEAPIPEVIVIQNSVEEEISENDLSKMADSAVENAIEDLTHSTGDLTGTLFRADTQ